MASGNPEPTMYGNGEGFSSQPGALTRVEDDDGAAVNDYVPEGYESANEFLTEAIEEFTADVSYDRPNRDAALDDLRFLGMDQWDPTVRAQREAQGRPCLTIDVLTQFVGQVIGDRRINETAIKVRPRTNATQEEADARSGIIKSIEAYSRAERVYDAAGEDMVSCGIGNFRIAMEYAENDVFDQDIFIRPIPNPLAVVWDRLSVDITGRDARHCFVQDVLPRKVYNKMFPDYPCPTSLDDSIMSDQVMADGWFDLDVVRITEYWRMVKKRRMVAMFNDGKVVDITDMPYDQVEPNIFINPRTNRPLVRETERTYAQMHLITPFAILEGPYELPLTRLPIIRVMGREVRVGDDRVRFGLVRKAKDAQRMKNYHRSVAVETLALAPKAQWFGPADAFEGYEDDFRNAHRSGDPILKYAKNASVAPQRMDPPPLPQALYMEANNNQQDIKDTTGLHDASLGIRSNEISGRAIQARQREGDVATVIYHDNINAAIQEGGDVVNQLIPVCYDTTRQLRVIGPDNKHVLQKFNDPNDPDAIDITDGKYDVSLETGPSFTTQRQEAAEAMLQAIQVAPQIMGVAGDLIVKAQDWPGSYEIAERIKKTMPPEVLGEDAEEPSPEQQQAQAQQQAVQQALVEQQTAMAEAELKKAQADAMKAEQDARRAEADAERAEAEALIAKTEADVTPVRNMQELDNRQRAANEKSQALTADQRRRDQQMKQRGAQQKPKKERNTK